MSKEYNWEYSRRNGVKIEVVIKDQNWQKIDTFKCEAKNFNKIYHMILKKYGIKVKPETPDPAIDWMNEVPL